MREEIFEDNEIIARTLYAKGITTFVLLGGQSIFNETLKVDT